MSSPGNSNIEVRPMSEPPTMNVNNSTVLLGGSGAVEKLEGAGNYHNWKFSLKMTLKLEGLWDLIERGDNVALTDLDAARDQRALACLCLSVKPGLYQYVREAATAREAWRKLSDVFEDRGLYRRVLLLRQLHRIEFNDYNTMSSYIEKVMSLVHQLKLKKKEDGKEPAASAYLAHSTTELYLDSGSSNHLVNNKNTVISAQSI